MTELLKKFDLLTDLYGINEELVRFAMGVYGVNEETLENICYYFGIDIEEQEN